MRRKRGTIGATLDRSLVISLDELPNTVVTRLKREFTKSNPKFFKTQAMGFYVGNIPREIKSWEVEEGLLHLPRGAGERVKEVLFEYGMNIDIYDDTLVHEHIGIKFNGKLRPYQKHAVTDVIMACEDPGKRGCVLRGPPGSGKTVILLATIAKLNLPSLVVVHSNILMNQWRSACAKWLGFEPGCIGGGKKPIIKPVTIAMQQTLWSVAKKKKQIDWLNQFSVIAGDECHHWAASTYQSVARLFRSRYFIAVSADERRKDGLEFLITDTFGPVAHEIKKEHLVELGNLVPVHMKVVETGYADDDYLDDIADRLSPDWVKMITRLSHNHQRNKLIAEIVESIVNKDSNNRILVLGERVDACVGMYERLRDDYGIAAGLMIGGVDNKRELQRTIAGLASGRVRVGVGTSVADEGMDIPALTHVVLTCPVHNHPKRLTQMIGRTARPHEGKKHGTAIYMWDRLMFPPYPLDDPARERGEENFLNKLQKVVPDLEVIRSTE